MYPTLHYYFILLLVQPILISQLGLLVDAIREITSNATIYDVESHLLTSCIRVARISSTAHGMKFICNDQ